MGASTIVEAAHSMLSTNKEAIKDTIQEDHG
jgi:hypothetical protein